MAGGFDGDNPTTLKFTGNDISVTTLWDLIVVELTKVVQLLQTELMPISNPDEFDINLLVTPGIVHEYHNSVSNHGISKVESRADDILHYGWFKMG